MRSRISGTFVGCLLLTLAAACGSDKAAPSLSTLPPGIDTDVSTPGVADTEVSTSGGSTGAVLADDHCQVNISGDVTASFDSPGGTSNIGYGPWVPGTGNTLLGVPLDDTFFIMNCQGPDEILITVGVGNGQHLPMAPAIYPIRKADNIFGGYDSNSPVVQVMPFLPGDFFWAIAADSTFTITEFDATHIAGTFQFYVSEAKSELITDGLPAKTAVIDGTFNLKNPN